MKKILILAASFLPLVSFGAEVVESTGGDAGLKAIAAALTIALGAVGGAYGQGKVASAAMEGIARNPQAGKAMFVPFMVGLAMIESLVLFCLVIAMIKT
ncbi:MAG: ATP synthase F0 subunit C [Bdellovibrionales bacterium]